MKTYLNMTPRAGAIEQVKSLGFDGIRMDIRSQEHLKILKYWDRRYPEMQWMLLLPDYNPSFAETVAQEAPQFSQFDLGWEAYMNESIRKDPSGYCGKINVMAERIWKERPKATITVNTIERLSLERIEWLLNLHDQLHPDIDLSIHAYRPHVWWHEGWPSTEAMFTSMAAAVFPRGWWNTETGWHSGTYGWFCNWWEWLAKLFGCKCRRTEEEIGNFVVDDMLLHKKYGAKGYVVYQAYTGTSDKAEDQFGLLDENMQPKQRAKIISQYLKGEK